MHFVVIFLIFDYKLPHFINIMHTMVCFHAIPISLISGGDHIVLTIFCGDYPCMHYFYIAWLITQWFMTLLRMPHCGITVGNDIAMDIHCDITMGNDVAMCTYHDITMHNDVAMNLFCYVLLHPIMILLFHQETLSLHNIHKPLYIIHINH